MLGLVLRAWLDGAWTVLRAPLLVAGVAAVTLVAAVPFGWVLGNQLQAALVHEPPIARDAGEIDPEWWSEFRHQAGGLGRTFTPAILGFAAPLGNISALVDRPSRPLVLAVPVALSALLWAFLWGGVLHRFARRRSGNPTQFLVDGWRCLAPFAAIALASALLVLLLFLTVHAWLFGPVLDTFSAGAGGGWLAVLWRLGLYGAFSALLVAVSLVADYTRVAFVAAPSVSLREALTASLGFISRRAGAVVALSLLGSLSFAALLAVYGASEIYAGTRAGGWRAVVLGQAFIVARLALRLTLAASEMRLFQRVAVPPDGDGSERRQ